MAVMSKQPPDHPTLRFDGCIVTNLEQAHRHLEQVYEQLIGPLRLTILEWYTLRALYQADGVTASHLAQMVCRHPSSMTALFDRMEREDLLRREVDAHDRRSVRVFLTARGRALEPTVCDVTERLHELVGAHVSPQQLQTFLDVLGILQNLDPTQLNSSPEDAAPPS